MPIVDSMVLSVKQAGVNLEGSPLDFLPPPYSRLAVSKPVFNTHVVLQNNVVMTFHEVPHNFSYIRVLNNLKIKTGDSSLVNFTTEPILMEPTVDKWCQQPITLQPHFVEMRIKPVKKISDFKGLISLEIEVAPRNDKYKRDKLILNRNGIVVHGRYYDGDISINGEMDYLKPSEVR